MKIVIDEIEPNFYVTDEISTIPVEDSNSNWENRYKFVTDLAAVSRGKEESNNPKNRFLHLIKEASKNRTVSDLMHIKQNEKNEFKAASRPLEFLPVVLHSTKKLKDIDLLTDNYSFFKHVYISNGLVYTNFRHVYNWLVQEAKVNPYEALDYIPFNTREELKNFIALKVSSPMFVWAQLMTHTQISKESQSDRIVTVNNSDYWLPPDLINRLLNLDKDKVTDFWLLVKNIITEFDLNNRLDKDLHIKSIHMYIKNYLTTLSQDQIQDELKVLGYEKEIYQRAYYYFRYKPMVMTGWSNDPSSWGHFLLEREAFPHLHKSWVQKETALVAKSIAKIIKSKLQ